MGQGERSFQVYWEDKCIAWLEDADRYGAAPLPSPPRRCQRVSPGTRFTVQDYLLIT